MENKKEIINLIGSKYCTGCEACLSICPVHAISMVEDDEGFKQPVIDINKCIKCSKCIKTCPISNNNSSSDISEVKSYAAINRNSEVRENSSSGGLFYLFAEYIIKNKGVVFGAKINDDFSVMHSYAETLDEVKNFQGSKYVQSQIGDSFIKCKEFLDKGILVLFSGTPCQIYGLKSYLSKKYENLFTIDVICHGVPSTKILKSYIKYQEKKAKSQAQQIAFRRKNFGWKQYAIELLFNNSIAYCTPQTKDIWMLSFNKNVMLRQSCYNCNFKSVSRISDITLADLWGIEFVAPELDDNKGTSLLMIQSEKGRLFFENLKKNLIYKTIDLDRIKRFNSFHQTGCPKNRDKFIKECFEKGFDKAYFKYVSENLFLKIYRKIRRCLGKTKRLIYKLLGLSKENSVKEIVSDLLETGKNIE